MSTRYSLRLPDPRQARGDDAALAFRSEGAEGMAAEFEQALRSPDLFEAWRTRQEEPDDVDPGLGATDPAATVKGQQHDLAIDLVATTSLPASILKQRLRWLAGGGWELRDVTAG